MLSWKVKAMAPLRGGQSESAWPQITQARPVHKAPREKQQGQNEMKEHQVCGKGSCVSHSASLPLLYYPKFSFLKGTHSASLSLGQPKYPISLATVMGHEQHLSSL